MATNEPQQITSLSSALEQASTPKDLAVLLSLADAGHLDMDTIDNDAARGTVQRYHDNELNLDIEDISHGFDFSY